MSSVQSTATLHLSMPLFKGKAAHRSWPQLPEELVRLITNHYLWDLAATSYCPSTWDARKLWHPRMVYTCIRDSIELEKSIMSVCPEWRRAIEKHLFWNQAIALIDPNDTYMHHMVSQVKVPHNGSSNAHTSVIHLNAYQHFHNLIRISCFVCRINFSYTSVGLLTGKRSAPSFYFGPILICRDHDRRRNAYCGLCLKDGTTLGIQDATTRDFEHVNTLCINENEDDVIWKGVETTCRKCRSEWLWRRASGNPRDRDAIGGNTMQSPDWETRQCVDGFLDMAEGTIEEVLTLAREKWWLRKHTKYESLGQHALAAQQSNSSADEADSDEDREMMLVRDSNQVKEMALHDWARQRILDGHWISPADVWYNNSVPGRPLVVRAVHPCPWAREGAATMDDEEHPLRPIYTGEVPPTYSLCEQAFIAHMRQMQQILIPPMRNIVRKLVMEAEVLSSKGYEDPTLKAGKMTLEDVLTVLREEEGVWYDGVDWIERRKNEEEALRRRAEVEGDVKDRRKEDDSASTTSSGSGTRSSNSNATSPVLSTTTLQTTPSPPPLSDEGTIGTLKKAEEPLHGPTYYRPATIPVDPVRPSPQLLRCIPYVPVTIGHMPHYSLDAFKAAWRDACIPLYHCRCSICERAKKVQAEANAAYAALVPPLVSSQQPADQTVRTPLYPALVIRNRQPGEIDLTEVGEIELDGDGEEEVDYDGSDLEEYEDEDEDNDSRFEGEEYSYSVSPEAPELHIRPQKRSSDVLQEEEEEEEEDTADTSDSASLRRHGTGGTPPKRARIGDSDADHDSNNATLTIRPIPSPARQKKRSSEELEEGDAKDVATGNKRAKLDKSSPVFESPIGLETDRSEGDSLPSTVDEDEHSCNSSLARGPILHRRISKADIDKLIPLDDLED